MYDTQNIVSDQGRKFDFPLLAMECARNGLVLNDSFGYVDTLDIARAIGEPCSKLQCLVNGLRRDELRPHRAVDDCFALREVCKSIAHSFGLEPLQLLSRFAFGCDVLATVSNLSVMTADPMKHVYCAPPVSTTHHDCYAHVTAFGSSLG